MSFEPYVLLGVMKCYRVRKIEIFATPILFINKNKHLKLMSKLMSIEVFDVRCCLPIRETIYHPSLIRHFFFRNAAPYLMIVV